MTDPKKPASAPAASSPASTSEQDRLQRLREQGGRILDDDAKKWSEAAARVKAMDEARFVAEALAWKEKRGKYPWEEPPTKAQTEQAQWLRNFGIDPDKIRDDSRREMEELIRKHQEQKKTDGRGR